MWWLNVIVHHRAFLAAVVAIAVVCVACCATNAEKVLAAIDKFKLQTLLDGDAAAATPEAVDVQPRNSGEERCREFIRRMTGIEFKRVRPSWLRNPATGRPLELDMFTTTPRPIAFEFDGQQHARYTPFYHGTVRAFEEAQARDRTKDALCAEFGVELVRIPPESHDQPEAFVYGHLVRMGLVRAPGPVVVTSARS